MRFFFRNPFVRAAIAGLAAFGLCVSLQSPADAVVYRPPLDGSVVDKFRPPTNPYGPGNRGWEYQVGEGTEVRAAAPGTVTFAGQVGGTLNVVIQHEDGVRTTLSKLREIDGAIAKGTNVAVGQRIGVAGGALYFGARCGNEYIDPAKLFGRTVYLVPMQGPSNKAPSARDADVCDRSISTISDEARAWLGNSAPNPELDKPDKSNGTTALGNDHRRTEQKKTADQAADGLLWLLNQVHAERVLPAGLRAP